MGAYSAPPSNWHVRKESSKSSYKLQLNSSNILKKVAKIVILDSYKIENKNNNGPKRIVNKQVKYVKKV